MNTHTLIAPANHALHDLQVLWQLFVKNRKKAREAFEEYHLIRRKYILSQVCGHMEKNKYEPAPLLGVRLLDVGCGLETMTAELTFRGADVTAIDPCKRTLAKAEKQAQTMGAPATFMLSTAEQLATTHAEQFDVILCLDVLESCKHAAQTMNALTRLLKPGGVLVFSGQTHSPISFFWHKVLAPYALGAKMACPYSWRRTLTPDHLCDLTAAAGLKMRHLCGTHFDIASRKWVKTAQPDIRYLGAVVKA